MPDNDRSFHAGIFFSRASDSIGAKDIYHLCYGSWRSFAAVRLRPLFENKRERERLLRLYLHAAYFAYRVTCVAAIPYYHLTESERRCLIGWSKLPRTPRTRHLKPASLAWSIATGGQSIVRVLHEKWTLFCRTFSCVSWTFRV